MVEECSLGFLRVIFEEDSPLTKEGRKEKGREGVREGGEGKKQPLKLWKSSPSLVLRGNTDFPVGRECARGVVMLKALYLVSAKKLRDLGAGL